MKLTNNLIKSFAFFALFIFTASGCKKETTVPDRDKFIGTYQITYSCSGAAGPFNNHSETIQASSGSTEEIVIGNFLNLGNSIKAKVSGDIITIGQQVISLTSTSQLEVQSGNGTLTNGTILNITVSYKVGTFNSSCTLNGTKQ